MSEMDTRTRILDAALQEFSAEGFAGARVDTIARLAGCNKQLIYHYFKDKGGLYEAVTVRALSDRPPADFSSRADFAEVPPRILEDVNKKRAWLRLLMWEALASEERPVVAEAQRSQKAAEAIADVENAQKRGFLDGELPARFVGVALMGMILFPFCLPQMARMMTGLNPSDPVFRREYSKVLRALMKRLGSCPVAETVRKSSQPDG